MASSHNDSRNNNGDDFNRYARRRKIEPARKELSVAWRYIIACDSGPAGRQTQCRCA
ncbi:MAG: hypothetical protein R3C17_13205 [Planctomycetaceae bacterium]